MITIRGDGLVILSRCDYLYRDGRKRPNKKEEASMGDGDIIVGKISPEGYKDLADAQIIAAWINRKLKRNSKRKEGKMK